MDRGAVWVRNDTYAPIRALIPEASVAVTQQSEHDVDSGDGTGDSAVRHRDYRKWGLHGGYV
jgi:hypothetical protein